MIIPAATYLIPLLIHSELEMEPIHIWLAENKLRGGAWIIATEAAGIQTTSGQFSVFNNQGDMSSILILFGFENITDATEFKLRWGELIIKEHEMTDEEQDEILPLFPKHFAKS